MNRRALLGWLACVLAPPRAFAARRGKVLRLGALFVAESPCPSQAELLKRWNVIEPLAERGYVEGRSLIVESRCVGADLSRVPRMAVELVSLRPDVLITVGTAATQALKDATRTIPIVTIVADPVASGFASTLSRPGGNITGRAVWHPDTPAKQIELLRRVVPKLERLTLIGEVDNPAARGLFRNHEAAAKGAGLVTDVKLVKASGFEPVFREMRSPATQAAFILFTAIEDAQLAQAAQLAIRHRVPTMYYDRGYIEQGGLMSFTMYPGDRKSRVVHLIADIFEGANPAEMPWELPDRVYLAINLRTARLLGLNIPSDILVRADQVVE